MKLLPVLVGCWFASISLGMGQTVTLSLALEQEQFLAGESLIVKVRITNFSGQNLEFGKDDQWLTFSVENSQHFVVGKRGYVPVKGAFTLEHSQTGTKKVDLEPHFELTRVGRYYVTAMIGLPELGRTIQSKAITVDIISGNKLWEQDFGMPKRGKETDGLPEIRKFALIQTSHSKTVKLYLRLTDARESAIHRVVPFGQVVSFGETVPQVDKFSNFHVLYQSGGRTFVHCLVNPDGVLISRETFDGSNGRPVLRPASDGRIVVVGGTRLVTSSDLPPPVSSTSLTDAKPAQP